jgi:hypothetical protein
LSLLRTVYTGQTRMISVRSESGLVWTELASWEDRMVAWLDPREGANMRAMTIAVLLSLSVCAM